MYLICIHVIMVSDQYIGNLLKRDLLFGFVTFLKELFVDCGWPKQVAGIPIAVSISIPSSIPLSMWGANIAFFPYLYLCVKAQSDVEYLSILILRHYCCQATLLPTYLNQRYKDPLQPNSPIQHSEQYSPFLYH